MKSFIIALDVGGTSIKAGIIENNELVDNKVSTYSIDSSATSQIIIDRLLDIIYDLFQTHVTSSLQQFPNQQTSLRGVALAFPGPFDYINGISYMQNLAKYDSIYGVNLKHILTERILSDEKIITVDNDFAVLFENDATMFAFGEYLSGYCVGSQMTMFLTLGTGCGSTFLRNGEKITESFGRAHSPWIYNQYYRDGIVDDYISRRGLLRLAEAYPSIDMKGKDVIDLANMAKEGSRDACRIFSEFGAMLGEVISEYAGAHNKQVDLVIIGGNISRSFNLFSESMMKNIKPAGIAVKVSHSLSRSTLLGAAALFEK